MLYAIYLKLVRSGDSPKQISLNDCVCVCVLYHLGFSSSFLRPSLFSDKCSCFLTIALVCVPNRYLQDPQINVNTHTHIHTFEQICALSVTELCAILGASGGLPAYGKSK